MEKLVSSWYRDQPLPQNYIFPADKRPGDFVNVPLCNTVPVIDLAKAGRSEGPDRSDVVEKILKASQEFGFFQVINHGVSENLMEDTMNLFKEFFDMPAQDKAGLYSENTKQICTLSTSGFGYANQAVHYWRDSLKHPCNPLEECIKFWPQKPTRYREVVGAYSVEVRKLSMRILKLICEGLLLGGLEEEEEAGGYFGDGELCKGQLLNVNHYPPCPDPSLTLGLPKHCDPNLITILQQADVCGLQVFKDGQWIGVEPLSNAFVINIGHQLQIISNGKLKSAEHRAVTNSNSARTTVVTLLQPSMESTIEPAKPLISQGSPPLYRAFQYKDFVANYAAKDGDTESVLEPYKIQLA